MSGFLGSRAGVALAGAALSGVLVGGMTFALADTNSFPVIHACVKKNGDVRIVGASAQCSKNETPLSWNQQGPPGPPGPPGPSSVFGLTVHKAGPGGGAIGGPGIDCRGSANDDCTEVFPTGTTVTLGTNVLNAISSFSAWSGDCSGTTTSCTLTMDGTRSVTGTFSGFASTSMSATKTGSLAVDNDGDNALGIGDVIQYTIAIQDTGTVDAVQIHLADSAFLSSWTLVNGTVTTSSGTVTQGNAAGDMQVGVDVPSLAPNGSAMISFRAVVNGAQAMGTFPLVVNQATVTGLNTGSTNTTDPNPDTTGLCVSNAVPTGATCRHLDP